MVRVRYSFGSRHTGRISNIKKQRPKYPDVMKNVVEISDIVLEVLDARYIEETRNLEMEAKILDKEKKLVYVLNKCDLIEAKEMEKRLPKWMRPYVFVSATKGTGLSDLKARIKMEAKRVVAERKLGKTSEGEGWKRVHVGVIGYPNAGKSSVINFVTRRGAAPTAGRAGHTKGVQKIRMSEGILVLDTPGVIPEDRYTSERKGFAEDVKFGARSYSDVKDPERAVLFLVRAPPAEDEENLTEREERAIVEAEKNAHAIDGFYGIDSRGDVEILIEELGRKKGFLGKGGVVDEDRTARLILRDWQEGRIRVK
jgi:ribosome biogenesis GTPase A